MGLFKNEAELHLQIFGNKEGLHLTLKNFALRNMKYNQQAWKYDEKVAVIPVLVKNRKPQRQVFNSIQVKVHPVNNFCSARLAKVQCTRGSQPCCGWGQNGCFPNTEAYGLREAGAKDAVCLWCSASSAPISVNFLQGKFLQFSQSPKATASLLELKSELSRLGSIPKLVHVTWKTKFDIDAQKTVLIQKGLKRLKQMNPDWKIMMADDNDVSRDLAAWLKPSDWKLLKDRHVVEKTDLWRLMKVYRMVSVSCVKPGN
jgi:hypothetical protein